jgi:hypothetical protein
MNTRFSKWEFSGKSSNTPTTGYSTLPIFNIFPKAFSFPKYSSLVVLVKINPFGLLVIALTESD